jgi:hypothetical protein
VAILRHIAPFSAFKVGLLIYGLLGLAAGTLCSAVALAGAQFAPHSHMPRAWGALALILCPVIWGTIGGVVNAISALLYNVAAGWIGGLELDLAGTSERR